MTALTIAHDRTLYVIFATKFAQMNTMLMDNIFKNIDKYSTKSLLKGYYSSKHEHHTYYDLMAFVKQHSNDVPENDNDELLGRILAGNRDIKDLYNSATPAIIKNTELGQGVVVSDVDGIKINNMHEFLLRRTFQEQTYPAKK